ncbi:MAG: LysE family transporter [Myxococcales bacterium]|nr:LysE family transporter [Myxococcales bacterium]
MLIAALVGFAFGFIGSMPVAGPIAVLVFARGVEGRFRAALAIAAGSALSEMGYAFLAFWGFAAFLAKYAWIVPASRGVAAAVLAVLGIVFVRKRESEGEAKDPGKSRDSLAGNFFLGFTICALNPTLIATWTAAATTLFSTGLVRFEKGMALPFALGACVGIISWFSVLIVLVRRYRGRFKPSTLDRIIRVMGVVLLVLAGWFAFSLVQYLIK